MPNSFNTSKEKFLGNEEVASIITIIGGGYGKNFDIDAVKKKWNKIIFLADADSDGSHIKALLLRFFIMYMPQLIEEGLVYGAVPPLYGLRVGKNKFKYFTTTAEYVDYVQKNFSKSNVISAMNNRQLSYNELSKVLINNIDYIMELENVSTTFAIDPQLLELILWEVHNPNYSYKKFKNLIEKTYRFLTVSQKNGIVVIDGLVDKIQTIFLNDKLINSCKAVMDILYKNDNLYYKLNGDSISIYQLMKTFEKATPDKIVRYKGLGEQNASQLSESVLMEQNRTLIRYTVEDIAKEIEAIRFVESDKSVLLKDLHVSRQDIE